MSGAWEGRRVFVTGATGMVGAWLVKALLRAGAQVTALVLDADPQSELCRSGDIARVSVVNGALEDLRALERGIVGQDADSVFHLGAQAIVEKAQRAPLATFETNIRGTYNLLEVCRLHADRLRRIVVASSDKAYGETADLPYRETMAMDGRHPYEVSKSCADLLARSYHASYGLPVGIARCGNIYGGGDLHWDRIVPGTIRSLLRGERPIIRSDGTYVRDYLYVEDCVSGYLALGAALDRRELSGEAFNFSTESWVTVREIVAAIQKATGRTDLDPVVQNQARGEIRSQSLSSGKARERLGWRAAFDLDAGLRETVAWYERFLGPAR
ncbi:MAG TPA: GDP-mannose 4,6-dehydratase [Terriglobales bacterium]|nr:GDP-mannose 4,6-dehydratase [Terriglobales bacterium]